MLSLAETIVVRETAFQFHGAVLFFGAMSHDATVSAPTPTDARSTASHTGAALSDPAAWVAQHGDYLFRYALIRVRNQTVAEDLVQETLLAAFQGRDRFNAQSAERGWLTGILKHKVMDHFRRAAREHAVSDEPALPPELEDRFDDLGLWRREPEQGPTEWGEDAAALMQRKEFMAALRDCIDRLSARCANAFVMRELEAESSDQIQQALGISAPNFWVLLHRARMQLRLCLEQNWLAA